MGQIFVAWVILLELFLIRLMFGGAVVITPRGLDVGKRKVATLWRRIVLLRHPLSSLNTTKPPLFRLKCLIHTATQTMFFVSLLHDLQFGILLLEHFISRCKNIIVLTVLKFPYMRINTTMVKLLISTPIILLILSLIQPLLKRIYLLIILLFVQLSHIFHIFYFNPYLDHLLLKLLDVPVKTFVVFLHFLKIS